MGKIAEIASETAPETAFAKINLALHVRRRRADGYHELETLFAFVDAGDALSVRAAEEDCVTITGEFSAGLEGEDNLIFRALAALPREQALHITLDKRLPVAAGLGGGSADAGAVFRMVERLYSLPENWQELAAALGADVPACVRSNTCIGRGTGAELSPIESDLAGMAVLLVNPRVPLSTGPVFKGWDGVDHGPMPSGKVSEIAQNGRNDLEAPAISLCGEIGEVLAALAASKPWLSRMSGSGATCFALYESEGARDAAVATIRAAQPTWWQMAGKLRP